MREAHPMVGGFLHALPFFPALRLDKLYIGLDGRVGQLLHGFPARVPLWYWLKLEGPEYQNNRESELQIR